MQNPGMRAPSVLRPPSDDLLHMDALRLASALGIVGVHSFLFFFPRELRGGIAETTIGLDLLVDLFFTISGFVIAYFYGGAVRSGAEVSKFYRKRAARVLPLHWMTLGVSAVFWLAVGAMDLRANNVPDLNPVCMAHTALLLDGLRQCGGIPLNYVSWTLSVEIVMYAAFPALAAIARRRPKAFVFVAAAAAVYGLSVCLEYASPRGWLNLPPLFRAGLAFAIGMALHVARHWLRRIPAPRILLSLTLAALASAMIFDGPPVLQLALTYLSVALAVASDNGQPARPWVRAMSGASQLTYSIYMWHLLFVTFFLAALSDRLLGGSLLVTIPIAATCYASLLLWSYASFRWIETPLRRWLDEALSNLPPSRRGVDKLDGLPGGHHAVRAAVQD